MKRTHTISRNFEMLMGIVGSAIGVFSGSFLIFLRSVTLTNAHFLGFSAIAGSLLGLASSYYVKINAELAGIGFIFATVLVILGSSHINILSAFFLLVAGISALFRN